MATKHLDLGCGAEPRNPFGADQVCGMDARRFPGDRTICRDVVLDGLGQPDNHFDSISAFDFIEHVPRAAYLPTLRFLFVELMQNIWLALKPGGLFLSYTPAFPFSEAFQDPTHVNIITEKTFPLYFCGDEPWAKMYGFEGRFDLVQQEWRGPHLQTVMRKAEL